MDIILDFVLIVNNLQKSSENIFFVLTWAHELNIIKAEYFSIRENQERKNDMLFSSQSATLNQRLGLDRAIDVMIEAGYPCIDISLFNHNDYLFADDWQDTARRIRHQVDAHGVIFNQAHAPFGGGYDHYTTVLVPQFPRVFAFCEILGVRQIVVHPLQRGRYYGHEKELFDLNMDFYRSLIPLSDQHGIKICIENMWQNHPVNRHICDDVCADPHELAAYYDTLNDPEHFTVCLDIGHVALCGREPEDAIRILGHDRLGALHVHDVDYVSDLHQLPGMSKINWNPVIQALADIRYSGEFTLEADSFLHKFDIEHLPAAAKFMADTAKYMADKIEKKMAET